MNTRTVALLAVVYATAVVSVALIFGLVVGVGRAGAAFPGLNGKIVFTSDRDGNNEIYVMNPDGTGQTNLTNQPASDCCPAWSADGRKIAFVSDRTGDFDIFVMNADGSDVTNLTFHEADDFDPSWSPDGTKIAFSRSFGPPLYADIYVLTIGLSPPANVTASHSPLFPVPDFDPAWLPYGSKIAFASNRIDDSSLPRKAFELYLMNPDGGGVTGPLAISAFDPTWSPKGSKLAFTSLKPVGTKDTWISRMNVDGSDSTALTSPPAQDAQPAWSPDGSRIVFTSRRDGGRLLDEELYLMSAADGSGQTRLTNNSARDFAPDWQPIGAVGGYSVDLDSSEAPLEEDASSAATSGLLAGTTVAALTASVAIGGAIWYGRRRSVGGGPPCRT